jgi:branched-chain amino acid transport system ATP-binding protein
VILEVEDLLVGYPPGKIVLRGVSMGVNEEEIVVLMGHNGAGKTTLLNTIFGLLKPYSGRVLYMGREFYSCSERVRTSMSYSPQGQGIFPSMEVIENLELSTSFLKLTDEEFKQRLEMLYHVFPILSERNHQRAGTLSGGQQRMLALGMMLMQRPKLLLLDEPSLGLSPIFVQEVFNVVQMLNRSLGTSVLLVEQNARYAFQMAQKLYILKLGQMIHSGDRNILLNEQGLWGKL